MDSSRGLSLKLWFTLGLLVVFLVGLISVAFATGWGASLAAMRELTVAQVCVLLLLSLVNYGFRGLRWHIYTRAIHLRTSLAQDMRHYLGGFALTATPGRVGEFIRLRWIWRDTGLGPERTGALVLVDRAADLAAVGLTLAIALAFTAGGFQGGWVAAALAVVLAVLVTRAGLLVWGLGMGYRVLGVFPRVFAVLRSAARRLTVFTPPRIILPATMLGMVGWCAEAYAFWLLLGWLGADIGMALAIAIFFCAMLTGGATGMPGGIGGAEAAMIAGLALQGVPLEIAIPATAVSRITTLWFAIAVGFCAFPFAERYSQRGSVKSPVCAGTN